MRALTKEVSLFTFDEVWKNEGFAGVIRELLQWPTFEAAMCFVVVANSIVLGLEQSYRLEDKEPPIFARLELAFMVVYIVELLLQFSGFGLRCLRSNWVRFDIFLVLATIVGEWIVIPNIDSEQGERLSSLGLLRSARLLRLARAVRLIVKLKEMRMLALGLASSFAKLLPTLGLGTILLYVMGCAAVELIPLALLSKPDLDPEAAEVIQESFRTLPVTMLTLVQFMTLDGVNLVYKPLIDEDSSLGLFFVFALLVLGVIFMNLVTATMVSRGLEQAMEDKIMRSAVAEARRRGLILDLEKSFYQADTDKNGSLSRSEVEAVGEEQRETLQNVFGIESLVSFFDCLDIDGNGALGIDEFCHGLEGILVSQVPLEIKHVERLVQSLGQTARESQTLQEHMAQALTSVSLELRKVSQRLEALPLQQRREPEAAVADVSGKELREALRCALDEACEQVLGRCVDKGGEEPKSAAWEEPKSTTWEEPKSSGGGSSPEGSSMGSRESSPRSSSEGGSASALSSADGSWLEEEGEEASSGGCSSRGDEDGVEQAEAKAVPTPGRPLLIMPRAAPEGAEGPLRRAAAPPPLFLQPPRIVGPVAA